jgi:putative peptidoglycan lipid II flippase
MSASPPEVSEQPARLLHSTSIVGGMTLLSRISGLVRDIVFSRAFGASPVMDAFFVAFKIPNLLRRFFSEGAFAQAFVPLLAEYRVKRSRAEMQELLDRVAGTLGAILLAISALGVLGAPLWILLFAPGFVDGDGRYGMATEMLRFTFPYLLFISLTGFSGAVLNTHRRFAVPAFTPVLLNLVLILFAVYAAPHWSRPGLALAVGVFVAGVVQLLFQAPFLLRMGLMPRPRWGWAHEGVRRILRLMLPVMFGSSVAQISILFDTLIASFLAAGSVSWLYYSDRLMEFPLGVFGIALATVILPNLSEQHARASVENFSSMIDWALRLVVVIGVPAALALMVLAEPVLTTIFYGGAFTEMDVRMATASLIAYALGLLGFILVKVLSPAYFARQDTRTPVRIGIGALALNMALNVVFVLVLLRTQWAPAHAGLALATTIAAFANAGMLWRGLIRNGAYRPTHGWPRLLGQVALASLVMVAYLVWARRGDLDWTTWTGMQRALRLAACVVGGLLVYLVACFGVGLRVQQFRVKRSAGTYNS